MVRLTLTIVQTTVRAGRSEFDALSGGFWLAFRLVPRHAPKRACKRLCVARAGRAAAARDDDVGQRLERDPEPFERRHGRGRVLAGVADSALGEHREETRPRRGGAAGVADDCGRLIADVVARRAKPPAEIHVLAVEEEALVEPAQPVERVAA